MGVTQRYGPDPDAALVHFQIVSRRLAFNIEGYSRRLEYRHPHVHPYTFIRLPAQFQNAGRGVDPDDLIVAQSQVTQKQGHATRTIATLFHFSTIGVIDAVGKLGIMTIAAGHHE